MSGATESIVNTRKLPFAQMRLDDHTILDSVQGRYPCEICNRSRKFFCYSCYIPVGNLKDIIPHVELPVHIDIIKHPKEIEGKSTAAHAAVLSKHKVRIHIYPDIPDYSQEEGTVLIFPGSSSVTVSTLFGRKIVMKIEDNYKLKKGYNMGTMLKHRAEEIVDEVSDTEVLKEETYTCANLPIRRAVFIDSTWNQSRGIYKDKRVRCLQTVILQNRCSQFWRHQRGSPRWYLSTIEAIHQFLLEVHVNAWGLNPHYRGLDNLEIGQQFYNTLRYIDRGSDNISSEAPYNGQYDNLMFFFANMYDLIHRYYDHNQLKSYRRPI